MQDGGSTLLHTKPQQVDGGLNDSSSQQQLHTKPRAVNEDGISITDQSAHQQSLKSGIPSEQVSPDTAALKKASNSIHGQSDWLQVHQTNGKSQIGRQSLSSSAVSFDRASDQMVHGGVIKKIGADDQGAADGVTHLRNQASADPFEVAPSASKKGFEFTEVKEIADDEDSAHGTGPLKQGREQPAPDKGVWDNFSELNNTDQIEGGAGDEDSEFGSLNELTQGFNNSRGAKNKSKVINEPGLKDIGDDDFEIDPHLDGSKRKFANNRENLRQGVSSGFNFKDILASGQ